MSKNSFIVITGPTAAGKTNVAVRAARMLCSEVISADSAQIYRGMDIGTAKATKNEMQGVPHHFIDIVTPDQEYSAAEFQKKAFRIIDGLCEKNTVPVVAGGTGLYVNSLVYNLDFFQHSKNDAVRQKYQQLADDKGMDYLYNILKERDPEYANIISCNDIRRIIRRLEIIDSGSEIKYNFRQYNDDYDIIIIGLTLPRETLYERINRRVDIMLEAGLFEEVYKLYQTYGDVNAFKAIGYKEIIGHIKGEYEMSEAVRRIKRNTRRFAKRQMTWFKRDARIVWFDISKYCCIEDTINDIIKCIKRKGF